VCMAVVLISGPAVAFADQMEDSYQALQQAVAKKDPAQVKKLVADLTPLVKEALAAPAPTSDEERALWKNGIDYAKSIQTYQEYALFATAAGASGATLLDLISTLEQLNPKSQYLEAAYGPYLAALVQTGAQAKVIPIAEKAIENFPNNVDLLAVLSDNALSKMQKDRALAYANRLTAAFGRPRPEGVADAEWARKRSVMLGRGYWMAGVLYGEKNDWNPTDKNLRAALPLIQGNNAMMGPALFYLGLANYQLGKLFLNKARMLEGAKFSQQCAAIPGPLADQARHNAAITEQEARAIR